MSTKLRKKRVRIFVGLREYEVRSNPYLIDNIEKESRSIVVRAAASSREDDYMTALIDNIEEDAVSE